MATPYEIDIAMDQYTVDALTNAGFQLFAFKGVQANSGAGAPVVWFASSVFGKSTSVKWTEQYQGYTGGAGLISGGSIADINSYDMNLDQTLNVTNPSGTGEVADGGTKDAITLVNNSGGTPFTAGISESVEGGSPTPLCAFPLYGSETLQIAPIEKVLLMFAIASTNTGDVVYNAFTDGVLIDLTQSHTRQVNFDINKRWDWGNAGWGTPVLNTAHLAPLLIDTPTSSAAQTLIGGKHRVKAA